MLVRSGAAQPSGQSASRSRTMNDAVLARGQAEGTKSLSIGPRAIVAAVLGFAVSALLVDCREPDTRRR